MRYDSPDKDLYISIEAHFIFLTKIRCNFYSNIVIRKKYFQKNVPSNKKLKIAELFSKVTYWCLYIL